MTNNEDLTSENQELTWAESNFSEHSVEKLDELAKKYHDARRDYEAKKRESSEAYHVYQKAEYEMIQTLKSAGKSKWEVEGIGKITTVNKKKISMPKNPEDKAKLFKYFKDSVGADVYLQLVTINHNTLNSMYKQELEKDPNFVLPGVEPPVEHESVRFTKERK